MPSTQWCMHTCWPCTYRYSHCTHHNNITHTQHITAFLLPSFQKILLSLLPRQTFPTTSKHSTHQVFFIITVISCIRPALPCSADLCMHVCTVLITASLPAWLADSEMLHKSRSEMWLMEINCLRGAVCTWWVIGDYLASHAWAGKFGGVQSDLLCEHIQVTWSTFPSSSPVRVPCDASCIFRHHH